MMSVIKLVNSFIAFFFLHICIYKLKGIARQILFPDLRMPVLAECSG